MRPRKKCGKHHRRRAPAAHLLLTVVANFTHKPIIPAPAETFLRYTITPTPSRRGSPSADIFSPALRSATCTPPKNMFGSSNTR